MLLTAQYWTVMLLFIDAVIAQFFVVSGMFLRPFRLLMTELIRSVAVFATTAITLVHRLCSTSFDSIVAGVPGRCVFSSATVDTWSATSTKTSLGWPW